MNGKDDFDELPYEFRIRVLNPLSHNQDLPGKPSERIDATFFPTPNGYQTNCIQDIKREMDVLHQRLALLEQQLLSSKYANAQFKELNPPPLVVSMIMELTGGSA